MQHVKPRWLTIYARTLLAIDVLIFSAYYYFSAVNPNQEQIEHWGLTPLILITAFVHALYVLLIFPLVRKRSEWIGSLVSIVIFIFLVVAQIEVSEYYNLTIRGGYALLIFSTALIGPFITTATVVVTWIILLYTHISVLNGIESGIQTSREIVIDVVVTVAGILGWYLFKRFYVKEKDVETIALSKMLEQEQFKSTVMLESITDGVMIINAHGTVQVLNNSAAQMLGWSQEEALKLDYRSLLIEADHTVSAPAKTQDEIAITTTLTSRQPTQSVSLIKTKNDRSIFVDIVASPIFEEIFDPVSAATNKRLVGIVAILRDVDKQKRQEQQRSDFISTASHEMRTPVASIQGYIELALNAKVSTIDDKARAYLEKAHEATRHLGELFQDLLTASQSEDGRLSSNPKLIDVQQFISSVSEQERSSIEAKGLQLKVDIQNGTKIAPNMQVYADPDRLREAMSNLIENAVKYTPSGVITIGATTDNQSVILRVSDTGIGIALEDISHIFQKFYRTDNSEIREIGGTGLGLYIVKQLVEQMNGRVTVRSSVGVGSTFFIELPRINSQQPNTV